MNRLVKSVWKEDEKAKGKEEFYLAVLKCVVCTGFEELL